MTENMLELMGYHEKWHAQIQAHRRPCIYSTNDFIISEVFQRLEISCGTFVEFGAWDGLVASNTRKLFEEGWGGLLIEADSKKYGELKVNYENHDRVTTVNCFIDTDENLIDKIFTEHLEENIDFCSIDIDGLDLDIFETFEANLPKVVCMEGGQVLHPLHPRVPSHVSAHNIQQSLSVINEVFEGKGYKLLCAYQDCFFVKQEYYHLFDVDENLTNQYIDGLIALPRIPYLKDILDAHGFTNEIVEQVMVDIGRPHSTVPKAQKMAWVDAHYLTLRERLEFMKE